MRDPFTKPFCEAEDLGLAIPDSDHAVSVCLPRWDDVIGYEEGDESILDALEGGYPRFMAHPLVAELCEAAASEFAKHTEGTLVFPSLAAAWRAADYIKRHGGKGARLESYGWGDLTVLICAEADWKLAWKCWQHGGEIVSSRLAESALSDAPLDETVVASGAAARELVRGRIASFYPGSAAEDVFLFSSGMAAIFAVQRTLSERRPGLPTIQIEFPYIDAFKVQERFGSGGVVDFSLTRSGGLDEVTHWLKTNPTAAGVFTELPSNPLLRTADLARLAPLLRAAGIPLVVDDTVATSVNVETLRFADIATCSLPKAFSGAGDVAGGAVILRADLAGREAIRESLALAEKASPLFERDAIVLEVNSRHYRERVEASNANATAVVASLQSLPEVERIWYPTLETPEFYEAVRHPDGGTGGLISFVLRGGEAAAKAFYDRIALCKGPSLGTDFSLLCPYTLLAHYGELPWAEERGVRRDLLRLSVGLEDEDDLLARILTAVTNN